MAAVPNGSWQASHVRAVHGREGESAAAVVVVDLAVAGVAAVLAGVVGAAVPVLLSGDKSESNNCRIGDGC